MITRFPYHERFEGTQSFFRQQLVILEEAIPPASETIRPILMKIRRSAIALQSKLEAIHIAPPRPATSVGGVACFDCGTQNLEVFHTCKQGGYHLCSSCFDHRARTGRARSAH